jgi:hypothetical protein
MHSAAMTNPSATRHAAFTAARHLARSLRAVPRSGRDVDALMACARPLVELPRAIAADRVHEWDPHSLSPDFRSLRPGVDDAHLGIVEETLTLLLRSLQRPGSKGHAYAVQLSIIAEEMLDGIDENDRAARILVARAGTVGDPVDRILHRWGLDRYTVAAETGLGQFYMWDTQGHLPLATVSTDVVASEWLRQLRFRDRMSPASISQRPASWLGQWRPGLLHDLGLLEADPGADQTAHVLFVDGWQGSIGDLVRVARSL